MVNGTIINCEHMYYEMQTELPMFFWSRFEEGSDAGNLMPNIYMSSRIIQVMRTKSDILDKDFMVHIIGSLLIDTCQETR